MMPDCSVALLRRTRRATVLLLIGGAAMIVPAPAFGRSDQSTTPNGQGATSTTVSTECAPDELPELVGGIFATGAQVSTPGAEPRTLDERQATAFMQTWLAYSIVSSPPQEPPPPELPRSEVLVGTRTPDGPSSLLIFFVTNGTDVWVGAQNPEPGKENWIRAPSPADTIAAFNGELGPICDNTPVPSTTTPTTIGASGSTTPAEEDSGDDSRAIWIAVFAAVVAATVTVGLLRRRRSRSG